LRRALRLCSCSDSRGHLQSSTPQATHSASHVRRLTIYLGLLCTLLLATPAFAQSFAVPVARQEVVGMLMAVSARADDTLVDIARRYRIGQDEIVIANPAVDRWAPADGAKVILPTAYILPRAPREGLVLNVSEMRLYYYPEHIAGLADLVHTYSVSIGRQEFATPLGTARVVKKTKRPSWRPPQSIVAERASYGETLPSVVPPGPDNPLGELVMRLNLPGYLIHGTNKPYGVGMPVTHGCVRMYPEDMQALYSMVPIGTAVTIVDQPVKLGWLDGMLYIEVHPPFERAMKHDALTRRVTQLLRAEASKRRFEVDRDALRIALELQDGVPIVIGRASKARAAANP
jgi:L,D-transpeptidase ErfK/SrfK